MTGAAAHAEVAARTRSQPRITMLAGALATLLACAIAGPAAATEETPQRHAAAERLGLRLLNCTRTGGWVRADGSCKGYGSGRHSAKMRALRLHDGISRKVAVRWSRQLVIADACGHEMPGQPTLPRRFSLAGFTDPTYGENVGCSWGGMDPLDMVLATHRAMQAEKADRGGHWRNMKNRAYRSVGIGVTSLDGMTTIVYDFYGR